MRFLPITILFTALIAVSAEAALIASEDFEGKTLGGLNGQGGGSGFAGTWSADAQVSVVASTLSYTNGDVGVDGGSKALEAVFANADIVGNLFSRTLVTPQSGTVYLSLLYREVVNPVFGNDFIQVGFQNTDPDQPLASVLRRNGAYQVRTGTSSPAGNTVGATVADFSTHLLVMKAEKVSGSSTYNRISLFVDPSSLTEPGTATNVVNASGGLSTIGLLTARTAFHAANDTLQIDSLRVGEDWADVVTAVPEPSSGILIGLGCLGWALRRRR